MAQLNQLQIFLTVNYNLALFVSPCHDLVHQVSFIIFLPYSLKFELIFIAFTSVSLMQFWLNCSKTPTFFFNYLIIHMQLHPSNSLFCSSILNSICSLKPRKLPPSPLCFFPINDLATCWVASGGQTHTQPSIILIINGQNFTPIIKAQNK